MANDRIFANRPVIRANRIVSQYCLDCPLQLIENKEDFERVEEPSPMKRGLKVYVLNSHGGDTTVVEEPSPMKRGLKVVFVVNGITRAEDG